MVFTNAFLVTIFALPRHRSVNSLDMADDKFPVKTIVLMALEHAVVETAEEDGEPASFLWVVARKPAGPTTEKPAV